MKILGWIGGIGLSLAVVFLALAASTAGMSYDFGGKTPAVKTTDRREWTWDGGDRVEIAVPASVHYQAGGSPRVVVTGPADLLERVRFQDGKLKLVEDFFGTNNRGERLDVTLTGMTLHDIAIAGSARMDMGEIHQDRLKVSIEGSGQFSASGNADDLSLHIEGSGAGHMDKLQASSLQAQIEGSGHVEAGSPQSARVSIAGSGRLRFAAMPQNLSSDIEGSGRISDEAGRVIDRHGHREWS